MTKAQPNHTQDDRFIRFTGPGRKFASCPRVSRLFVAMLGLAAVIIGLGIPPVIAAQQSGKILYEHNCAVCHGVDGEGAMPGVKDLVANSGWMSKTDAELTSVIVSGVQGADSPVPMPPRAGNPDLTNEQIMSIVTYLRNLAAGN